MPIIRRPAVSRYAGLDFAIIAAPAGLVNDEGEAVNGLISYTDMSIRIEDGLAPQLECETLVHETLHQILGTVEAKIPDDLHEYLCALLGRAIIGHIRDNPSYWRWLLQQLRGSAAGRRKRE